MKILVKIVFSYGRKCLPIIAIGGILCALVAKDTQAMEPHLQPLYPPPLPPFLNQPVSDSLHPPPRQQIGMIGIEPIGMSVGVLPSFGATLGLFIDSDSLIEINHARGGLGFYVISAHTRVTSLRWKKFWGRSFYTNAGLALRTMGANFSVESLTLSRALNVEVEITSLVGDLSIGNMWRFERFAMGVDWLGWMPHFEILWSYDEFPYHDVSPEERRKKRSRFDRYAKFGTPQFLRFHIAAFF